jgi:hypothetical protein
MPSRMQAIDGRSAAHPRIRAARDRQGRRDACGPAPSDVSPCCCRPVRRRRRRAHPPMTPVVADSPRHLRSWMPRRAGCVPGDRATLPARGADAAAARPGGVVTAIHRSCDARLRSGPHGRQRGPVSAAARQTASVHRLSGPARRHRPAVAPPVAADAPVVSGSRGSMPAMRGCGRLDRLWLSWRILRVRMPDPPSAPIARGGRLAHRASCAGRTADDGADAHGWWR